MTIQSELAKLVARTKANVKTDKVKHFVRSLRSRLTPSNIKTSEPSSTSERLASVSPLTYERRKSSSTPSTLPSSAIYHISPSTSSNPQLMRDHDETEECHCTEYDNLDNKNTSHGRPAPAPLPTSSSRARGRSSESFPHRSPRRDELDHGMGGQQVATAEQQHSRSHTLSLTSLSSPSTWSFACSSARCMEREHDNSFGDSGSSFGSLSGWGVTCDEIESHGQPSGIIQDTFRNNPSSESLPEHDSEEFDMLPDWADVEDDPCYNVLLVRDSDVWSITSIASSDAEQVQDALMMPDMRMDDHEDKKRDQECGGEDSRSKRRKLEGGTQTKTQQEC